MMRPMSHSSDKESAVNHRGSEPFAPTNGGLEPDTPGFSPPFRHPPDPRPLGVTMAFDRHLGRAWVIG